MHAPIPADRPAFTFNVDRVHLIATYADVRYATPDAPVTVSAMVCYRDDSDQPLVVMVDGNHGTSITNAADRILPFIHRHHLGRRGFKWKDVRWLYRDTQASWDEIRMLDWDGTNVATVGFQPCGDRTLSAVLTSAEAFGFAFDSHLRAHLRNAIDRAERARSFRTTAIRE